MSILHLSPRRLVVFGLAGVLSVTTVGYANSNALPGSAAGDGSAAISGYTVTNVHYTLNTNNPSQVDSVSFTISPALAAGGTARVSLNGGSNWLAGNACSGTTTVICSAAGASVTALGNLRVVAAQ